MRRTKRGDLVAAIAAVIGMILLMWAGSALSTWWTGVPG